MRIAAILVAVLVVAPRAHGDPGAVDRMIELNRQALADYGSGDLESARRKLIDAVILGTRADLDKHRMMGRTYLHLAAVFLGLKDRDKATRYMGEALRVRPDIQPTAQVASPELDELLASQRKAPPTPAAPELESTTPAVEETVAAAPIEPPAPPAAAPPRTDTENPLTAIAEARRRKETGGDALRRAPGAFFVGVGIGSGYGWHPERRLEFHRDQKVQGRVAPSGDLHALPEVGYQLRDDLALSVQGRLQLITARGTDASGIGGAPARGAFAVLARAQKFFGAGQLHLVASANLGVGDAFRFVIEPQEGTVVERHDTVRGGPVAIGPGVGLMYHFGRSVAAGLESRLLLGAPTFAAVMDLSTAFQVAF